MNLGSSWDDLISDIGGTPTVPVEMWIGRRRWTLWLKLEGHNPLGSVKDRTACGLIRAAETQRLFQRPLHIVESTSGNLGAALAAICEARGHSLTAVVDPKTTRRNLALMAEHGARVEMVDAPDADGSHLRARIARVRDIAEREGAYWTNQYANRANPDVHYLWTGPELVDDVGEDLDAVFVPVSTGGTLAGIARYVRSELPRAPRLIGVDAAGSAALCGAHAERRLPGFGASFPSRFIAREHLDAVEWIPDAETVAVCRKLADEAGLFLGGSSGAVVAACVNHLGRHPGLNKPACICPDGGAKYADSIYDDGWVRAHGLDLDNALDRLDHLRLRFAPTDVSEKNASAAP